MKDFLQAHDMPNWTTVLFFLLCYMHTILGERLEMIRREKHERIAAKEKKS